MSKLLGRRDFFKVLRSTQIPHLDRNAELRRMRKEHGVFFTPKEVARSVCDGVFFDYFPQLVVSLRRKIERNDEDGVFRDLESFLDLKVCDPMVGDGAFARESLASLCTMRDKVANLLSDSRFQLTHNRVRSLLGDTREAKTEYRQFAGISCIYGVDVHRGAVEKVRGIVGYERIPIGSNIKQGDSLITPEKVDPQYLSEVCGKEISGLVRGRQVLKSQNAEADDVDVGHRIETLKRSVLKRVWGLGHRRDLGDLAPFIFEIEFPEIFFQESGQPRDNPGFDFVIGNPPWEVVKPNDREFFATFVPDFFKNARSERDRLKIEALRSARVRLEYQKYLEKIKLTVDYFRRSGYYSYQMTEGAPTRNVNLYKIGFERFYRLARHGGRVGIVTPLGISTDAGTKGLRNLLFDETGLKFIWGFDPSSKLFDGIDQSFAICIYTKGGTTSSFRCVYGLSNPNEILDHQTKDSTLIDPAFVKKTSPLTWSIPSVTDKRDITILQKMYGFPPLGKTMRDRWNVRITRGLDETNDRHMFRNYDTGVPLLKGKDLFPFTVGHPTIWVDRTLYEPRSVHSRFQRIAWRDVARPNLRRRMFAAIAPRGSAVGNSLNYMILEGNESTIHFVVGMMNSLLVDYRVRQITSNSHVNQFVVSQLPIPRLDEEDERHSAISEISRSLAVDRKHGALWDERECELNAKIAQTYGLEEAEVQHILESYDWLPSSSRETIQSKLREDN